MKYHTRFELKKIIGVLRQFYGTLNPLFELCDMCEYRQARYTYKETSGRTVAQGSYCKKCHKIKQYAK